MQHPDGERLVALALGEADESTRAHVAGCADCTAEVEELRALVADLPEAELVPPPPSVWDAVAAEIGRETGPPDRSPRTRATWWMVGIAASVAVVVGLAAGLLLGGDDEPAPPAPVATTPLLTLDGAEELGSAEVVEVDGVPELHVRAALGEDGDGFREVWLINVDGERMVSVGLLPTAAENAVFVLPSTLLEQGYRIVDISQEPYDGDPAHSGDSLVRGELPEVTV